MDDWLLHKDIVEQIPNYYQGSGKTLLTLFGRIDSVTQTQNQQSSVRSGISGIAPPMPLLTELDSLASPNYKDASPTGFEKSATLTHEKISLKNQKRNARPGRKPRLSLYERTKDLCGSVSGLSDLSTRKLIGYGRD